MNPTPVSSNPGHDETTVGDFLRVFARRWPIVIVSLILAVAAGIYYARSARPAYSVVMAVAPVQDKAVEAGAGAGGALRALIGGGGKNASKFDRYLTLLTSPVVAERMAERHDALRRIFLDSWDAKEQAWRQPQNLRTQLRAELNKLAGLPAWTPPNSFTLSEWMTNAIMVVRSSDNDIVTIRMVSPFPELMAEILLQAHEEANAVLREMAAGRSAANSSFLQKRLQTLSNNDHRRNLTDMLSEEEKSLLLTQPNVAFAAELIDAPRISDRPVQPKPASILAVSIAAGLAFGLIGAIIMDCCSKNSILIRRRRDGDGQNGGGEGSGGGWAAPRIDAYRDRLGVGADEPAVKGLVSIVTVVRNGAGTLPRTIDSVRAQTYPNIEYIIVDGGSTDGTLDVIQAADDVVSRWISEPDDGISDAFNKGVALARGEYVAILNADDWMSPNQMACAVETLTRSGADFVFGDLVYYRNGVADHRVAGDPDYARRIPHVMPALNHPSVVARRSAYARVGLFRTSFRLAMDYEWLLRLHRAGGRGVLDRRILGHMSLDGESDRGALRALAEVRRASVLHGYPAVLAWPKYWFRVVKSRVRRGCERYLPRAVSSSMRASVNRAYRPTK